MNGLWKKAYDLADDRDMIETVQKATLKTEDRGLVPDVALFGPMDWWKTIEEGKILKREMRGRITRLYMTGHRDLSLAKSRS